MPFQDPNQWWGGGGRGDEDYRSGFYGRPKQPAPTPWGGNPLFDPNANPAQAANTAMQSGFGEAQRLHDTEEQRGQRGEDILRTADVAASKPTISDADVSRMTGQITDSSGNDFMQKMGSLRAMLGESGLTGGGYSAGIAASLESARNAANRQGLTNVLLKQSAANAQDRFQEYSRQTDIAKQVQREPSMALSDFFQQLTGVRLAQQEISSNDAASKRSASATESAGKTSAAGGIIGSLIGLA